MVLYIDIIGKHNILCKTQHVKCYYTTCSKYEPNIKKRTCKACTWVGTSQLKYLQNTYIGVTLRTLTSDKSLIMFLISHLLFYPLERPMKKINILNLSQEFRLQSRICREEQESCELMWIKVSSSFPFINICDSLMMEL